VAAVVDNLFIGNKVRGRSLPPLHIAALWLVLGLANAWFAGWSLYEFSIVGFPETDWQILRDGVASGYASEYRWSPLLLPVLGVVTAMPFGVWVGLHFLAAFALPSWPLRILTLVSWPFWQDTATGNVMVFVLLTAVYALRGHRSAVVAFWLLTALSPRPLMIPVAVWLAWREGWWGLGLVAGVGALGLMVDPQWLIALLHSGQDMTSSYNFGPSALIGWVWLPIGLVLAAWLTWNGRLGLASLAVSPYWLPYYGLMALIDLRRPRTRRSG
jgi:hypothetical protein